MVSGGSDSSKAVEEPVSGFKGHLDVGSSQEVEFLRAAHGREGVSLDGDRNYISVWSDNHSEVTSLSVADGDVYLFGDPYLDTEPLEVALSEDGVGAGEFLTKQSSNLYGHFLILHHDDNGEVSVYTDKASSLSFYYYENDGSLFFTSNVLYLKDIWGDRQPPEIRDEAIYEYLSTGYLWGRGTFWNEVHRLGPGEHLHVGSNGVTTENYWQLDFDGSLSPGKEADDALLDAIEDDLSLLPDGKAILTLSGGYDSRGLLGFLDANDIEFDIVSYSFGDEYDGEFDAEVANYYASKLGHDVQLYEVDLDVERLLADIENGIEISGGESDVVITQDAFLGEEFYSSLANDYEYMIRGDEVWGFGDYVIDRTSAFFQALMFNFDQLPHLDTVLSAASYDQGQDYIRRFQRSEASDADEYVSSANELKDYIYWKHREARLLQNMASLRRHYLPHYAPYIFGHSFDVVEQLSDRGRSNKRVFRDAMRQRFPVLFKDDEGITRKKPTKSRFEILLENEAFADSLEDRLLDDLHPELERLFDVDALEEWIEEMLASSETTSSDKRNYNILREIYEITRKNDLINALIMAVYLNLLNGGYPSTADALLFRVFSLNETLKKYTDHE